MTEAHRILVVTDEMEVGGSQRQIVHLLLGLAGQDRAPELLYFRKPSFLVDQVRAAGVKVHRIEKRGRLDLRFFRALIARLREGRYDVVHCFSITAEIWVWLALRFAPGARLVSSVRGLCLGYSPLLWRLKAAVSRASSAIIANSRAGADETAQRAGVARGRIDVVPNGVTLTPVAAEVDRALARAAWLQGARRLLLLFVGRLVVEKNVEVLIRALARLPAELRPITLIAGDGPLRGALESASRSADLEDTVRFLGERDDVSQLMQAADLFVLPSREEGLSNVILEAMGAGLPVIASAVGGNPELVDDGRSGLLFANDDDAALAGALARALRDEGLRQRLGREARARAERDYSTTAMVARTVAIYDRCLEAR